VDIQEIEQTIYKLKASLIALETQVTMMNPAGYIEFKGELVSTLKSIIHTIDIIEKENQKNWEEYKTMLDKGESVLKSIDDRVVSNTTSIKVIKAQAALIAFVISVLVPLFIALLKSTKLFGG
jgi:hypothetical protein